MRGKRLQERTEISGEGDKGRGEEADRGRGEVESKRRGEIGEGDQGRCEVLGTIQCMEQYISLFITVLATGMAQCSFRAS